MVLALRIDKLVIMNKVRLGFFSALIFASSCHSQHAVRYQMPNPIVLINVGSYNKEVIAKEIAILNTFRPKVIALDIAFPKYSGDKSDKELMQVLENVENLVMPSRIHTSGKDYYGKDMITVVGTCALPLVPLSFKRGFVSAKIDDNSDAIRIPSKFIFSQKDYGGENYYHFSLVTAMIYDSLTAATFLQQKSQPVDVEFRGKYHDFKVVSGTDLLNGNVTEADISGKIIMMGFLGPGNEDKFISPLNKKSDEPDMYGLEYLAHIVAQILNSN
jgi:CHASE2 domain-containing sensor protein